MDIGSLTTASMMARMTPLHDTRLDQVLRRLKGSGARRVLDLGCGSGHLLYRLAGERQFEQIVGLESCSQSLLRARELLSTYLHDVPGRLCLINGSYAESQPGLGDYDAAAMVETIEHLKPGALSAAEQVVFAQMRPRVVYLTTPNREYNPLYGLYPGEFREPDHEFERDRARFRHWSQGVARRNGYRVALGGIGEADPEFGQPTQTAYFTRLD